MPFGRRRRPPGYSPLGDEGLRQRSFSFGSLLNMFHGSSVDLTESFLGIFDNYRSKSRSKPTLTVDNENNIHTFTARSKEQARTRSLFNLNMVAQTDDTNTRDQTPSEDHHGNHGEKRPLSISSTSSTSSTGKSNSKAHVIKKFHGVTMDTDHTDTDHVAMETSHTSKTGSTDKMDVLTDEDLVSAEEAVYGKESLHSGVLSDSGENGRLKSGLTYIEKVVQEILVTEATYVADLLDMIEGYLQPMRDLDEPEIDSEDIKHLFGNIEEIYDFNRTFLSSLQQCVSDPAKIAQVFVNNSEGFKIYTEYCTNYPSGVAVLTRIIRDSKISSLLKKFQMSLNHNLPIGSYLLKPVQRILKYHLLLQSMKKRYEQGVPGYRMLQSALSLMVQVAEHINEMKRRHEREVRVQEVQSLLDGWEGDDLTTLGDLLLEGTFRMYGAKAHRHVFLFEKGVILAKRRQDGARGWSYKAFIECSNLMLIESIPKEPLSFHIIPFDNPKIQYTLQAKTLERKQKWCSEIKKLILENYNAAIPEKAKNLVMQLGKSKEEDEKIMESIADQGKKPHHAPQYLEKRLHRRKSGTDLMKRPKLVVSKEKSSGLQRQNSTGNDRQRSKSQPHVIGLSASSENIDNNDTEESIHENIQRVKSWGDEPSAYEAKVPTKRSPLRAPSFKQAIELNRVDSLMVKDSIRTKFQSLRRKISSTSSNCSVEDEGHSSRSRVIGDDLVNIVFTGRHGSHPNDSDHHETDEEDISPYNNVVIAPRKTNVDIGDYIHFSTAQEYALKARSDNERLILNHPPLLDVAESDEGGDYILLDDLKTPTSHIPSLTGSLNRTSLHKKSSKMKNSVSFSCDERLYQRQMSDDAGHTQECSTSLTRSNSNPLLPGTSEHLVNPEFRKNRGMYSHYGTPPRDLGTISPAERQRLRTIQKYATPPRDTITLERMAEFEQGATAFEVLDETLDEADDVPPPLPPRSVAVRLSPSRSRRPATIATCQPESETTSEDVSRDDELRPHSMYSTCSEGPHIGQSSSSSGISNDSISGSIKHLMVSFTSRLSKAISPKASSLAELKESQESIDVDTEDDGKEQKTHLPTHNSMYDIARHYGNKLKAKARRKNLKKDDVIDKNHVNEDEDKPMRNTAVKPKKSSMLTKHLQQVTHLLNNNKTNIGYRMATAKPIVLGENYTLERQRPPRPQVNRPSSDFIRPPKIILTGVSRSEKSWSQYDIASSSDETDDTVLSDNDSIYEEELSKVLDQDLEADNGRCDNDMFRDSAIYSDLDSELLCRVDGHSSSSPPRISIKETVKNIEEAFSPKPVRLNAMKKRDIPDIAIKAKLGELEKSLQYKPQGCNKSEVGLGVQERLHSLKEKLKYTKPETPVPDLKVAVSKTLKDRTKELEEQSNKPIKKQVTDLKVWDSWKEASEDNQGSLSAGASEV